MTVRRILRWLIVATCCNPATILAQSQPGPIIDLAGEWAAQVHEDAIYRGAGGFLGDYTGLPINAASRQMAESWDADTLSQPERQTQAHPAQYAMRGEGPNVRISEVRDPVTDQGIVILDIDAEPFENAVREAPRWLVNAVADEDVAAGLCKT